MFVGFKKNNKKKNKKKLYIYIYSDVAKEFLQKKLH